MERVTEVAKKLMNLFTQYHLSGMYFLLFLVALLLLFFMKDEKEGRRLFLIPSLLTLLIIYNPLIAHILMDYILGEDVYWRMFWILPMIFTVAFVFSKLVAERKKTWKKILVFCVAAGMIISSGKFVYRQEVFVKAENLYKVPDETIEIVDMIRSGGMENPKVAAPIGLSTTIRQYDGSIRLFYGRNAVISEKLNWRIRSIYQQINGMKKLKAKKFAKRVQRNKIDYVIFFRDTKRLKRLKKNGFEEIGHTQQYVLYQYTAAVQPQH